MPLAARTAGHLLRSGSRRRRAMSRCCFTGPSRACGIGATQPHAFVASGRAGQQCVSVTILGPQVRSRGRAVRSEVRHEPLGHWVAPRRLPSPFCAAAPPVGGEGRRLQKIAALSCRRAAAPRTAHAAADPNSRTAVADHSGSPPPVTRVLCRVSRGSGLSDHHPARAAELVVPPRLADPSFLLLLLNPVPGGGHPGPRVGVG
jgi:hypothetical protein